MKTVRGGVQKMTITIGDKTFSSRLMVGTGKFSDFETMQKAHQASGAEIVTVAIRRVDTKAPGHDGLMNYIDTNKYWILPNTAGCATVEEALELILDTLRREEER